MYDSVLSTCGDPGDTYSITGVDAAKTLAEYGVPVALANGSPAVFALFSIETQAARVQWGTKTTAGHVIAKDGSYAAAGPQAIKTLKIGNAAAGSAAAITVTCFF